MKVLIHVKCLAWHLAHSRCSVNGSSYLSEGIKREVSKGHTLPLGLELGSWFFHLQVSGAAPGAQGNSPSSSGPLLWLGEALVPVLGGRQWMMWKQKAVPESSGPMTAPHGSCYIFNSRSPGACLSHGNAGSQGPSLVTSLKSDVVMNGGLQRWVITPPDLGRCREEEGCQGIHHPAVRFTQVLYNFNY